MGILSSLLPGIRPAELTAAAALVGGAQTGIRSPWLGPHSHLEQVVWSDIFGALDERPMTRAAAMRVPAVARARHIICGTLARIELHAYRGGEKLEGERAPSWLTSTAGPVSAFHRMLMTGDDALFYGWSLWSRVNGEPDASGRRAPLTMTRVPIGEWSLEPTTNRVLIYKPDGRGSVSLQPANSGEVVLIPGPHEGLLVDGLDSIRHAADVQRAARRAARHPSAYLALKQQPGSVPLKRRSDDPTEVTAETVVRDWAGAREGENGGVAYLGQLDAVELGTFSDHLVIEGRNAASVDVARHASIPADIIDATMTNSSLQYTTSRDNDRRLIDYGLGLYMGAISGRLTLDDVTPRGQRIAFDLEEWLQGEAPGQPTATPAPGMSPAVPSGEPAR